jgi:hypothetical protein
MRKYLKSNLLPYLLLVIPLALVVVVAIRYGLGLEAQSGTFPEHLALTVIGALLFLVLVDGVFWLILCAWRLLSKVVR